MIRYTSTGKLVIGEKYKDCASCCHSGSIPLTSITGPSSASFHTKAVSGIYLAVSRCGDAGRRESREGNWQSVQQDAVYLYELCEKQDVSNQPYGWL